MDLCLVGGGLLQVEHHPGALAGLHNGHRLQVALVDLDRGTPHGVGHPGEIQRNAGGRLNGKACRQGRQGLGQINPHHLTATLHRACHRLNGRLGPHGLSPQQGQK